MPKKQSGRYVGNYKSIASLGCGEYSKVKLAVHVETGQQVAMKRTKLSGKAPEAKQMADNELHILKLLNHDSIIKLHDSFESPRHVFLALDFCSQGDLHAHLARAQRFPEKQARRYFRDLVSALNFCHQVGVIHRDVKLENILLSRGDRIRLADFGLASMTTDPMKHLFDTFCGSPNYAAPEVLRGIPYLGPPIDVWSLGVVLYALVVGRLPFVASKNKLLEVVTSTFPLPSSVSSDLGDLLKAMLSVQHTMRPTMDDLRHASWTTTLEGILPGVCQSRSTEIDFAVLGHMRKLGFLTKDVIASVQDPEPSHAKTVYQIFLAAEEAPTIGGSLVVERVTLEVSDLDLTTPRAPVFGEHLFKESKRCAEWQELFFDVCGDSPDAVSPSFPASARAQALASRFSEETYTFPSVRFERDRWAEDAENRTSEHVCT